MDGAEVRTLGGAAAEESAPAGSPRTDLHDPVQRDAVESSLTAISGVRAVRIVPGYERPVDELHVVTSVDREPKQVVRDVQTALMARHGVAIDHRVVSVAQLGEAAAPTGTGRRLTVQRVSVTKEGLAAAATVVLVHEDGELQGRDDGPSSAAGRRRAVARATLAALGPLLPDNRSVELEGADVIDVLGSRVALCLLHVHSASGGRTRTGSAVVDGDEDDAVARAVLDATNRLVGAP